MNVLFLISHDISLRFGCYGDPTAVTPNIDRLAADSMIFENHFCQFALCAPSRTNLFTGCRPDTLGRLNIGTAAWYESFRKDNPWILTLPEHLKNHGFYTRSIHKLFHECEKDPPSWSAEQWYAPWEAAQSWMPDDFECLDRATRYRNPESWIRMEQRFGSLVKGEPEAATQFKRWRGPPVEAAGVPDSAYPAGKAAGKVCEMLSTMRDETPFFLGAGFAVTHLPWLSPQRYWDLISKDTLKLPENMYPPTGIPPRYSMLGNEAHQYFEQNYHEPGATIGWKPDYDDAVQMTMGYYAAISYLDAQVGRIVNGLNSEGMWDDTIVVFTTDHGFAIGEHGHWGKHSLHEPDLRVPLIVHVPGLPPGRTAALTEHVDVFPTICELLGTPIPDYAEGTSFVPLLSEPDRPWKKAVFNQARKTGEMGYSIRTQKYRYSRWVREDGDVAQEELYDYQADPLETTSIHADVGHRPELEELAAMLDGGWRPIMDELAD